MIEGSCCLHPCQEYLELFFYLLRQKLHTKKKKELGMENTPLYGDTDSLVHPPNAMDNALLYDLVSLYPSHLLGGHFVDPQPHTAMGCLCEHCYRTRNPDIFFDDDELPDLVSDDDELPDLLSDENPMNQPD